MVSHLNFAPFRRTQSQPEIVDTDDAQLGEDEAKRHADFIKQSFREATGQKPVDEDDDADGVEATVGKAYAKPVRTLLAALKRAR